MPALSGALRSHLLGALEASFGGSRVGLWLGDGAGLCLDPSDGVLTLRVPHRFACERLSQSGMTRALAQAAAGAGLPAANQDPGPEAGAPESQGETQDAGQPGARHRHLRVVVTGPGSERTARCTDLPGSGPHAGGADCGTLGGGLPGPAPTPGFPAESGPAEPPPPPASGPRSGSSWPAVGAVGAVGQPGAEALDTDSAAGASVAGGAFPPGRNAAAGRLGRDPRAASTGVSKVPAARRPSHGRAGQRLEDFVVGPCNELAFAAAAGLAAGDHEGPLFLHGGCGLGKTHLLGGIVSAWRGRDRGGSGNGVGRIHATTGERFTNRFIDHARRGELAAFRREVRGCSLLAIDDVHFVAGKQKTQHELLHCFDAALAAGVPVVFASDRHPRELAAMGTALASRCLQGLVAELRPPAAAMRRHLIRELGGRRGLDIDEPNAAALEALAGPGVREIEGLLAKLDVLGRLGRRGRASTSPGGGRIAPAPGDGGHAGRAPTPNPALPASPAAPAAPAFLRVGPGLVEQLRRLERPQPPPARLSPGAAGVAVIADAVGDALGVEPADALGAGRSRPVVQARALVAHLARELTAMSYPEIARAMGRPSHSSVITADKRVRAQLAADASALPVGGGPPVPLRELLADLQDRLR